MNNDLNTKLLGALGVLLLVAGIWSVTSIHSVEAKGMPKCWLNSDGTVKKFYLGILKSTSATTKFPMPTLKRECGNKITT